LRRLLNAFLHNFAHAGGRSRRRTEEFRLGYVILVSEQVNNYMRKLQVKILKEYGLNPGLDETPHITLKQAFPVPALDPFERYFDKLVNETDPFEIVVRGFGFFDEGIIFMDVVQSRQLVELRKRIVQDLYTQFGVKAYPLEDDRYHFHATVAHGLPQSAFERARAELQNLQVEFRFVCDTFGILCHTGRQWITYKRSTFATTKHQTQLDEIR
jgi:2'-5' RNA ligase